MSAILLLKFDAQSPDKAVKHETMDNPSSFGPF